MERRAPCFSCSRHPRKRQKSQICGLTWAAVDLEARTLTVQQALKRLPGGGFTFGPPKVGSYRTVRLPERTLAALKAHRTRQSKERLAAQPVA